MKASILVAALLLAAAAAGAALGQASVLSEAMAYSVQIREGRFELAPKAVALLTEATKANPDNSALWSALGVAEYQIVSAESQPGGDRAKVVPAVMRATAAYQKAFALDPNNAQALAGRGASATVVGGFQAKPEMVRSGVDDLNRAVAMAPDNHMVRLQRAFFGVNLPPALKDDAAAEDDLKFLLRLSEGQRAGDVLHLMLGDLYAEGGKIAQARSQYNASNRPGSTTGELAIARLASLKDGGVPAADIVRLRSQLGSNCMMCHAR